LLDVSLTSKPGPTRWGIWREAVNFYSEQFETVKSIVARFPSQSVVLMRKSQSAFRDPKVACSTAYIRSNFGWLPDSTKRLGTQRFPTQESMDIMKNGSEELKAVDKEADESACTNLQVVLKRNPGFSTFISVWYLLRLCIIP
jgi:hypothetical protein